MVQHRTKKTYVISDIHGCYNEFKEMLYVINFQRGDKLILLGDYIDRGSDSYSVVKEIQRLQKEYGNNKVIALKGNHEQMLIDTYYELLGGEEQGRDFYYSAYGNWLMNGGRITVQSWENNNKNIFDDLEWFESLPSHYEDNNYIYVHGGLKPFVKLENQREHDKLWIREQFHNTKYDWGKTVIFGHTPYEEVTMLDNNKIGIDSGCVFNNRLSCLAITKGEIVGVYEVENKNSTYMQQLMMDNKVLDTNII